MSKAIYKVNFNHDQCLKEQKKESIDDSLQDNPTEKLETAIDETEKQQEQQKPDRPRQEKIISKRVFNFNFNFHFVFHLNIFLFFKNWWVKKFKKFVSVDSLQDPPTERLETVIYETEKQLEQKKTDRQIQYEIDKGEQERIRDFNEQSRRAQEARYHRVQALRRGPTFFDDPTLPPIPKMNNGRIKSLAESCHFEINE